MNKKLMHTNCPLVLDGIEYNLYTISNDKAYLLLAKLNALRMSARDLGMLSYEIVICGFPLPFWIDDVKTILEMQERSLEERKGGF